MGKNKDMSKYITNSAQMWKKWPNQFFIKFMAKMTFTPDIGYH